MTSNIRRFRFHLPIPILLLALAGCQDVIQRGDASVGAPQVPFGAANPTSGGGRSGANVNVLAESLAALRRGMANQEGRIERVRKAVQTLTDRFEKSQASSGPASLALQAQMKELRMRLDALDSEVATLRSSGRRGGSQPEKEDPEEEIRPAGAPQEPGASGSARSGDEVGAAGAPQQAPPVGVPQADSRDIARAVPPAGAPLPIEPAPALPPSPDPEADFNEGLRALKEERSFLKARSFFNRFITKNPTHELADDAQFWIGESYFEEKNFERAILAFNKVQVDYANGDKAPDALLKEALAFLSLGDKASARELLGRVVQKYPNSEAASAASEHLKSL